MTTEQQPEQVIPPEEATKRDKAEEQPTSRRVAYKSVLSAVVVGIIAIGGLSFFIVQQPTNPIDDAQVSEPSTPTQEVIKRPESEMAIAEDKSEQIDQRLTSLSGRIDRGFEVQIAHSADVKQSLASVAETVRVINMAVADLTKSNHALSQRIDTSISRLNTLIKQTRKRKVVQRKTAARPKPRPAKTPPFHVDAINVWDDETYVAISQAGRVAFLKSGEHQSGWTVARIDRLKGTVEFKGPVGQHHSVFIAEVELMEIVLAVLLLFGGFALGSATADKQGDVEPSSTTVSATQAVSNSVGATQDMHKCLSDKSGIYQDLSVPYTGQRDQVAPKTDTCEGACTDE